MEKIIIGEVVYYYSLAKRSFYDSNKELLGSLQFKKCWFKSKSWIVNKLIGDYCPNVVAVELPRGNKYSYYLQAMYYDENGNPYIKLWNDPSDEDNK